VADARVTDNEFEIVLHERDEAGVEDAGDGEETDDALPVVSGLQARGASRRGGNRRRLSFITTPASSIEAPVGAATWPVGAHVWKGNMPARMAKPVKRKAKTTTCSEWPRAVAARASSPRPKPAEWPLA